METDMAARMVMLLLALSLLAFGDVPEEKYFEILQNGDFEAVGEHWGWWGEQEPFFFDGIHANNGMGYAYLGHCTDCYEGIIQEIDVRGYYPPYSVRIAYRFETEQPLGEQHLADYFSCYLWSWDLYTKITDFSFRWSDEGSTAGYIEEWFVIDYIPSGVDLHFACVLDTNEDAYESWVYLDDLAFRSSAEWAKLYLPVARKGGE